MAKQKSKNEWVGCVKGTKNNLFYKKILTSPKGLSTGLPDMVVSHRHEFRIVTIYDCFISLVEKA